MNVYYLRNGDYIAWSLLLCCYFNPLELLLPSLDPSYVFWVVL